VQSRGVWDREDVRYLAVVYFVDRDETRVEAHAVALMRISCDYLLLSCPSSVLTAGDL
jgi:hypothetical protein